MSLFELERREFRLHNDSIVYHQDLASIDDLIDYSSKVGVWNASKYDFSSKSAGTTMFAKSLTQFQQDFHVKLFDMQDLQLDGKGSCKKLSKRNSPALFVDNVTLLLIFSNQNNMLEG